MIDDNDEKINLKLDEKNELLFKVMIQGTDAKTARIRLVCEGDDNISYAFSGKLTENGEIQFIIPEMKKYISGKKNYKSHVEVMVENRYFVPSTFELTFKESTKVVTESVKVKKDVNPIEVKSQVQSVNNKTKEVITESKKTVTGIDDKIMEEVAKSTLRKLLGR